MSLFSIIVDVATILGLIFAVVQLIRSASASRAAKEAAEEARDRVNQSYVIPSIVVLVQYARFVQEKVRNGEYVVARLRLQDIKDGISGFYGADFVKDTELQNTIRQIDLCLRAIDRETSGEGSLIVTSFCNDVEIVITQMQAIQSQINTKTRYESGSI